MPAFLCLPRLFPLPLLLLLPAAPSPSALLIIASLTVASPLLPHSAERTRVAIGICPPMPGLPAEIVVGQGGLKETSLPRAARSSKLISPRPVPRPVHVLPASPVECSGWASPLAAAPVASARPRRRPPSRRQRLPYPARRSASPSPRRCRRRRRRALRYDIITTAPGPRWLAHAAPLDPVQYVTTGSLHDWSQSAGEYALHADRI